MRRYARARSALFALLLSACTGLPGALPSDPPNIPPVRAERIPAPPPSAITLIWQPGHWDWNGQAYGWLEGEWVPRSGHGPLWQDGYWRRSGAGHAWVPAHWM